MTHDYYTSFRVSLRGKNIKPELFIDTGAFPGDVQVFFNEKKKSECLTSNDVIVAGD